MQKNKDGSRSLYLYTALIFVVALIMIIISFFGQSNLEKTNKAIQDQKSISEKSAALSEENMRLVEKNIELEGIIAEKDSEINSLNGQLNQTNIKMETMQYLMSAYAYYSVENYEKAKSFLEQINYETLEGDSKVLYTQILNDINQRKED